MSYAQQMAQANPSKPTFDLAAPAACSEACRHDAQACNTLVQQLTA